MSIPAFPLRRQVLAAALACAVLPGAAAWAADYPSRPVTLIVPFPPGGSNDLIARHMARDLGAALGQSLVIDNRPGAGGNMGATAVSRAAPDGYTLLLVSSTFVTNAVTQRTVPYDIFKDFAPVASIAQAPLIVAVNNDFPANDPKALVDLIRKNPGKFNYASAGPGSLNHFSAELLKSQAGNLQITHVPYRGGGPAVNDLIGGRVHVYISSAPAQLPMMRTGKIKGIAVTSPGPSPVAPELAPVSSAVPGYVYQSWWGVMAPAGTPPAIVEAVNKAINRVTAMPALRDTFLREGAEPLAGTPAQFGALLASEYKKLKAVAEAQNLVVD